MAFNEKFSFIRTHLELAQETSACHIKEARALKKNLEKVDISTGIEELEKYLQMVFVEDYKDDNPFAERLLSFFGIFCSLFTSPEDLDTDDPNLIQFLDIIFEYTNVVNDCLRYWSCALLKNILTNLKDLNNQTFDRIQTVLIERLNDPKTEVRIQAISGLHLLQTSEETEYDIIFERFSHLLQFDLKAKIRANCVKVIVLNKLTLPLLVTRTRDVSGDVQLIALTRISPYMHYLKIAERREIVWNAMASDFPPVKSYFSGDFFKNWLYSYNDDFEKLMKSLQFYGDAEDVDRTCRTIEVAIFPIFAKSKPLEVLHQLLKLNAEKTVDFSDLTIEVAAYWRMVLEYFIKLSPESERLLEVTLPDVPSFCTYINDYYVHTTSLDNSIETQFILKQLFLILKDLEITDPACARAVATLVENIFKKATLTSSTAKVIMDNLERIIVNDSARSEFICRIVSDIRFNSDEVDAARNELEQRISELNANLVVLQKSVKKSAEEGDYSKAADLEREMQEVAVKIKDLRESRSDELVEVGDAETLNRALIILEALLASPKLTSINPSLSTILTEFVFKMTASPNEAIQAKALMCYCLTALIDKKTAKYAIHIFAIPISAYHRSVEVSMEVLLVCIAAVCDMLMMHGPNLVANSLVDDTSLKSDESAEENEKTFTGGTSLTDIVQGLADLLDDENQCLQKQTVRCLGKLLYSNAVHSISLLARLILKWASPATDAETRCLIGALFERIHTIPNYTKYFKKTVQPIIEVLANAPPTSPLADANVKDIVNFLVALTSTESSACHTDLALDLCNAILEKPTAENLIYCKMLLKLRIMENPATITELSDLCDEMRDCNLPRSAMRDIVKFQSMLSDLQQKCNNLNREVV